MRKLVVRVVWWLSKDKDKDDDKIKQIVVVENIIKQTMIMK